jgi:hypothetical protein
MRFWDSSAIVPLVCREEPTAAISKLYEQDWGLLVWAFTSTEILSALCRRVRERSLSKKEFSISKQRLRSLEEDWTENIEYGQVRERAERLLEVHSLSAADALQLAAALVSVREKTKEFEFVTLDDRLAEAATREGFRVLGVKT